MGIKRYNVEALVPSVMYECAHKIQVKVAAGSTK